MLEWHAITSEEYYTADDSLKTLDKIYFLTDTGEICRGTKNYTNSVIFYETLPTENIVRNRLYVNKTTLEGKVYDGTDWITVTKDVDSRTKNIIESWLLKTFVWNTTNKTLNIQYPINTAQDKVIKLTGLGVSLKLDSTTNKLSLIDVDGNTIGTEIQLDLERFVTAGEYDAANNKIKLYFDAAKTDFIEIPVPEIFKVSATAGNAIVVKDDGLYVATVDISGKQDKITGTKGQIVGFDDAGNPVAQAAPEGGVTSFNGRKGAILPAEGDYTAAQVGARSNTWLPTAEEVNAVPTTRKINGKALTSDLTIEAVEIGAALSSHTHTADEVGAVPTARKVNNKVLSADISLTAVDVGAATADHAHSDYVLNTDGKVKGSLIITNADGNKGLKLTYNETTNSIDVSSYNSSYADDVYDFGDA